VVDGERLVDRAVRVLAEAGCRPVVVVLGAWVGDVPHAEVVVNERWNTGMASSLQIGVAAMERFDTDRVILSLVDLVGLTSQAVRRVMACDAELAAASYGGVRGHPVLMTRAHLMGAAALADGDRGARDYLAAHLDQLTLIEVGDLASGLDLDERP
jgi:nicotine blue oxidoreductase